jgi:hypothetical protein
MLFRLPFFLASSIAFQEASLSSGPPMAEWIWKRRWTSCQRGVGRARYGESKTYQVEVDDPSRSILDRSSIA